MRNHRLISLAAVLFLMACGNDQLFKTDRMTGCYTLDSASAPELRVWKDSGRHRLAIRASDKWDVHPNSLRAAQAEELYGLFRADTANVAESLITGQGGAGLFRLKKGATFDGKPVNAEYIAFLMFGSGPVYRVVCP